MGGGDRGRGEGYKGRLGLGGEGAGGFGLGGGGVGLGGGGNGCCGLGLGGCGLAASRKVMLGSGGNDLSYDVFELPPGAF